jgi:hypothetical protein
LTSLSRRTTSAPATHQHERVPSVDRNTFNQTRSPAGTVELADAMVNLDKLVATVSGRDAQESKFAKALATLKALSRKEGIPLAIVGGLAAIRHGYERFTKDIDVVARSVNLDVLARVAPQYGIKVIWKDPDGWHKLECEGVPSTSCRRAGSRATTHRPQFQAPITWEFEQGPSMQASPDGWKPNWARTECKTEPTWFR